MHQNLDPCPDQGRWAFVTTSPTTRHPSAAQRTLVRRHVMKDIGYSRRAYRHIPASTKDPAESPIPKVTIPRAIPSSAAMFADVDDDSRLILHQMFSDAVPPHIRLYREKWYPACVKNSIAFEQMLACCATHLFQWQPAIHQGLQRVALKKHVQALCLARERFNSLSQCLNTGYLIAILMFACYAHLQNEVQTWTVHMSAMHGLVASKTNEATQENEHFMRLYRSIDSIGSYAFGLHLSYPLPVTLPLPAQNNSALEEPLVKLVCSLEIQFQPLLAQAYESLQTLDIQLQATCSKSGPSILEDPWRLDPLVEPVARKFLFLMPEKDETLEVKSSMRAYLCSGGLLYLAELRRRSGINPVMTTFQVRQLKKSMNTIERYFEIDPTLNLWFLTVGALESATVDDQAYFTSRIIHLRSIAAFDGIAQYLNCLHQLVWHDELFETRLRRLMHIIQGRED